MDISCQPVQHSSYDPAWYERLVAVEDRHFWFRTRNRVIEAALAPITHALMPGYRVLEVGCGSGNVLRMLERACSGGKVVGIDLFSEGLGYARQRVICPLVQGDAHRPPFGRQFDVIGLFDVLEHLVNHEQVLHDLRALLVPGGVLLMTVPAHMRLWRAFDQAAHHVRRYEPAELKTLLSRAGFRVEYLTEYMMVTYPLIWLMSRLARAKYPRPADAPEDGPSLDCGDLKIVPGLNGLLSWLLAREVGWVAERRRLPIGTALLALARTDADPASG
jgi:SAM-dependent methyltransferase